MPFLVNLPGLASFFLSVLFFLLVLFSIYSFFIPFQKHLRTPDIVIGADTIVVRGLLSFSIVLKHDKCRKQVYLGLRLGLENGLSLSCT